MPGGRFSLGLIPVPDKVRSGEFHYNMGMYGSQEAAKGTMDVRPTLEAESIEATAMVLLSKTKLRPDVVVITGTPEQVFWLDPAASTFNGEGHRGNMASVQASSAPIQTVIPDTAGNVNISLGCFGCRKTTSLLRRSFWSAFPEFEAQGDRGRCGQDERGTDTEVPAK